MHLYSFAGAVVGNGREILFQVNVMRMLPHSTLFYWILAFECLKLLRTLKQVNDDQKPCSTGI